MKRQETIPSRAKYVLKTMGITVDYHARIDVSPAFNPPPKEYIEKELCHRVLQEASEKVEIRELPPTKITEETPYYGPGGTKTYQGDVIVFSPGEFSEFVHRLVRLSEREPKEPQWESFSPPVNLTVHRENWGSLCLCDLCTKSDTPPRNTISMCYALESPSKYDGLGLPAGYIRQPEYEDVFTVEFIKRKFVLGPQRDYIVQYQAQEPMPDWVREKIIKLYGEEIITGYPHE